MSTAGSARAPRAAAATIADVARMAGVSSSTVSRAFNHPHLLRDDTVARVKAAADQIGFRHNRNAKALSTGRSSALGLIVPDLSNPFFPPLVHAAQIAAEEHGYSLYILSSEHDAAREQYLAALVSRDVAGLILASPRMSTAQIGNVASEVRVVLINAEVEDLSTVLVSAANAIGDAIEDGVRKGVTGVAYIGSGERWWANTERENSARNGAAKHGLPYRRLWLNEPTYDQASNLMRSLDHRPDELLVAFDDIVAHGVLDGMASRGFRPTRNFRILGSDDALPINTTPSLATVHLDTRVAAEIAIGLLLSEDFGSNTQSVVVSGTYRPGETI